ncbi:MAG: cardiolipin synthase [Chlamydiales bacterium]|jgi:cardiolipin synthase
MKTTTYLRSTLNSTFLLAFFAFLGICQYPPTPLSPCKDHPMVFYSNQNRDDLRMSAIQAIESATESIVLAIFDLSDPQIASALKIKSQEGVSVTVIHDTKTSRGIAGKLGKKVKRIKRHFKGHMHLKILVVDEKAVWIGSTNMTWSSLNMHDNLIIGVLSPEIASSALLHIESLKQAKSPTPPSYCQSLIGDQSLELFFLPKNPKAYKALLSAIDEAQDTLKVAMFTWTSQELADAVIRAWNRGVKVETVIDSNSGKGCGSKIVKCLYEAGIPVALSQGIQLLHHKYVYIDEKTLVTGSANWTKSAFNNNDDCLLIIRTLNEEQKRFMDKIWEASSLESINVTPRLIAA